MPNYINRSYPYMNTYFNQLNGSFALNNSNQLTIKYATVVGGGESLPPVDIDKQWRVWLKIPVGSKEIRFKQLPCPAHNACFQVFHHGTGNLLIGTPLSLEAYYHPSTWGAPSYISANYDLRDVSAYRDFDLFFRSSLWSKSYTLWTDTSFGTAQYSLPHAYDLLHGSGSFKRALDYDYSVWSSLPPTDTDETYIVNNMYKILLGRMLNTVHPDVFPSLFVPKDSLVNGTGLPYFKVDNELHHFNVESEDIYWTGNGLGGLPGVSGDSVIMSSVDTSNWIDTSNIEQQARLFQESHQRNGHYFAIFDESLTYDQALAKCIAMGGYLAIPDGGLEEAQICTMIPYSNMGGDTPEDLYNYWSAWIGPRYNPTTGRYESPVTKEIHYELTNTIYTGKWMRPEVNRATAPCTQVTNTKAWFPVVPSHRPKSYICEWNFDPRTRVKPQPEEISSNYEELYIPEAHCTLIIGVLNNHYFNWEASWQERTDPDSDPCFIATPPAEDPDPGHIDSVDEPDPLVDAKATYAFSWNPAYDMRLPSTVAKNADYNVFYPLRWGKGPEGEEEEELPTGILDYDAYSLQWLTHLLRKQNKGKVVCGWNHLEDELAVNLTEFPLLGPILPEYKPSITGVGAKVMVTCTHAQLYQAGFDMKLWIEADDEFPNWEKVREWYAEFLYEMLEESGLPYVRDDNTAETPPSLEELRTKPHLSDYFPEAKNKAWYIEPVEEYVDGRSTGYKGSWIHHYVYFNYPFPCSSIVTLYPDLGAVEGISHIGSALVCAIPGKTGQQDLGEPWNDDAYTSYLPFNHEHMQKHNYYPVGINAEEADISLFLKKYKYLIPANVLTWPEQAPWELEEEHTVPDAYKAFIKWWWTKVFPSMRTQSVLDKLHDIQKVTQEDLEQSPRPQDATYMREDAIWSARRDSARNAVNVSSSYKVVPVFYPWSMLEPVTSAASEVCSGHLYITTEDKVFRGVHALYWLTCYYKNRIIGEGTDIYVGKVVNTQAKVIEVTFEHRATPYIKMRGIHISVVPDSNYPYYQFVQLSLDGSTWSNTIYRVDNIESSLMNRVFSRPVSFKFYVRVMCTSTIEDPKPVKIDVAYERSL